MPRKRNSGNMGCPPRSRWMNGAIRYQVPKGMESHWDGKRQFTLGYNIPEAFAEYARRVGPVKNVHTIGDLLQRYYLEVSGKKPPNSLKNDTKHYKQLIKVFNDVRLEDLIPQHIYQYIDYRGNSTSARREKAMLSHAFTKAVQWGYINKHPFKGEVRLEGEKPRTRYIEDWEIQEIMALKPKRAKDLTEFFQAYIGLKTLLGLRQGDMLKLPAFRDQIGAKIAVTTSKTGKKVNIEVTPDVQAALLKCMAARPVDIAPNLFCNRAGKAYTGDGFRACWQRFMKERVMKETNIKEWFTEHDLRAKVGSDAESNERARELLTHDSVKTTNRAYRRKPENVRPLR